MATTYSSGVVTAYGAALEGGFTGTYEDFCQLMATLPTEFGNIEGSIAQPYSSSNTYTNIGTYVWHNGILYKNIVPITTAETWTAAHWTAAVLGDDVGELKSAFNALDSEYHAHIVDCPNLFNPNDSDIENDKEITVNGTISTRTGYFISGYIPVIPGATICCHYPTGTYEGNSAFQVYDSNKNRVGYVKSNVERLLDGNSHPYIRYTFPENPTYNFFRLNGVMANESYYMYVYAAEMPSTYTPYTTDKSLKNTIVDFSKVKNVSINIAQIGDLTEYVEPINLFNVNDPNNRRGWYPDGTGWHEAIGTYSAAPFLMKAGVTYTALTVNTYGSSLRYLAKKCDANGNLVTGSITGTPISGTDYATFTSETDQYVIFKFSVAKKDIAMIVKGSTYPETYQPYFEPYNGLNEEVQVTEDNLKNVRSIGKLPYQSTDIPLTYGIDMDGHYTKGWLKLPSNYDPTGDPVPLIVFVHGSGDMVEINSSMTVYYNDYYNYLRDCGYALFDCYGYGNLYAVAGGNTWNTPTNKKCYHQGIEYVCKNYNIDRNNIFVACKSLGGVQAFGFYFDTTLNIKAIGMLAPFLDPVQICGGYTVVQRTAYRDDCGLPSDPDGVFINNTSGDALITYLKENGNILLNNNPAYYGARKSVDDMIDGSRANTTNSWRNNTECEGIAQRPLKIWVATDDTFYSGALNVCNSLKAGGYGAEVRAMPAGCSDPHHAVDTDPDAEQTENVTTRLGVVYESVPTAYYELGKWFDMWMS